MRYKISKSKLLHWLPVVFWLGIAFGIAGCNYPSGGSSNPNRQVTSLELTLAAIDADAPPLPLNTPPPGSTAPSSEIPAPGTTPSPGPTGGAPVPLSTVGPLPNLFEYFSQSGDTLPAIAARFEVETQEVISEAVLDPVGYLDPGTRLLIPNVLESYSYPNALFPDSEIIYSPSASETDIERFVDIAGGYLGGYSEVVGDANLSGAEIVDRVAIERSTNPRILLAFLEYRSNWVYGQPTNPGDIHYPIGFNAPGYSGLYDELTLAANHLNIGYYNWRVGELNSLRFEDSSRVRLSPSINAGTAAVNNLFAKFYERIDWESALYGQDSFQVLFRDMFGDPWQQAAPHEPLLDASVFQPPLELPFSPGQDWSFTGGPHRTLTLGSPLGALDFSPVTGEGPCAVSRVWVTAPAGGLVTRAGETGLALDLDGDGDEGTGWVLYFLHLSSEEIKPAGSEVDPDVPLGHPSCEGGNATGTHVHIARKYQGEWLAADGPVPFVLSGWLVSQGERTYEGSLTRDGESVHANPGGSQTSIIRR